jgi:hypothetical protein
LELQSGSNRSDRTWEFCQEPVASILDDAAAVFGDHGCNTIGKERFQFGVRYFFVTVHEPRIARYVSG